MAMNKDFAIFILTHGRADNVFTYDLLKKSGYTGKIYIIIDNEDETAEKYRENFGDKVIVFDKKAIAATFDEGDNTGDRRSIVYARNACFDIAENLGITYFMQLDDDYYELVYKIDSSLHYKHKAIIGFDSVIEKLLDYYKSTNFLSLAFAQTGDYIGGAENNLHISLGSRRKAMNSFICSTERRFQFIGRINEDVNTYTKLQNMGGVFMTFPFIAINQKDTQSNKGGMTELYLDSGTYIKSFFTVMYMPSSVTVRMMGETRRRLHHSVNWACTVPQIIREKYKISDAFPDQEIKRLK